MKTTLTAFVFALLPAAFAAGEEVTTVYPSDAAGFSAAVPQGAAAVLAQAPAQPLKVARVAPEGAWHSIGTGTWFEGLLTCYADVPSGMSWAVDIEESDARPGYYRVLPYASGSMMEQLMGVPDNENYLYVDATRPEAVFIDGDYTPYGVFQFRQRCPEAGLSEYMYASLADKIISWPAESVGIIVGYNMMPTNEDGELALALPGADVKDYSLRVSSDSGVCPGADNSVIATLDQVGADVAAVKVVLLQGYYTGSDDNYSLVAGMGTTLNAKTGGKVRLTLKGTDVNTALFAAVDATGKLLRGTALYAVGADDKDTWTDAGMAVYHEGVIAADLEQDPVDYEVAIQESATTPGLYRLVNPVGASVTHAHGHYLYINATEDDYVTVRPSLLGYEHPYFGNAYLWSLADYYAGIGYGSVAESQGYYGKRRGNVITMPDRSLMVGYAAMKGGHPEQAGYATGFRVTLKGDAGVEAVAVDAEAAAEYFDLQGRRVVAPVAGGLYLCRRGAKVIKTIVR